MRTAAVVACLALTVACTREVELISGGAGDAGGRDGGTPVAPVSCPDGGAPVQLRDDGEQECAGARAARTHRFALCACSSLWLTQALTTDSFDSSGLTSGTDTAAAVGTTEELHASAPLSLGGALHVADRLDLGARLEVRESLRAGGTVLVASAGAQVGTEAFIGGSIVGPLTVAGLLHVSEEALLDPLVVAAGVVRETIEVSDPCSCYEGPDLAATVAGAALDNANAAIGLQPDALRGAAPAMSLDLCSGTYYVSGIDTGLAAELRVHGRALLAVTGDIVLRASFTVTLDPGAELDLVVGGTLVMSGAATLGSPAAPARVRLWIASSQTVSLGGSLGAVVHAPRATVTVPATGLELHGSLLAGAFHADAPVTIHYDRAVLAAGVPCGTSPEPPVR